MATVIQKRLRKVIEDSMVSNEAHIMYANRTKYVVYHGRIEAKITPTFENIDAEEWIKQYHELNYDLEITETELKVARSTHKELFGGEEEEEAED